MSGSFYSGPQQPRRGGGGGRSHAYFLSAQSVGITNDTVSNDFSDDYIHYTFLSHSKALLNASSPVTGETLWMLFITYKIGLITSLIYSRRGEDV
ncbi:hypothetical protein CU098_001376, partial [Rhizopus stolonifer]